MHRHITTLLGTFSNVEGGPTAGPVGDLHRLLLPFYSSESHRINNQDSQIINIIIRACHTAHHCRPTMSVSILKLFCRPTLYADNDGLHVVDDDTQLTLSADISQKYGMATGVSRSRVQEFGTVYPPHCGSLILNLDTSNDFKGISVWRDCSALVTLISMFHV